jgi:quinone-modifying oxidoreductase, subunit QmoC
MSGMTSAKERISPDRTLLASVLGSGGEDLRKCMQCATCSAVCELANTKHPGPRKEMLWAQWGLAGRLMGDPDLWLCHQCGDCTLRCPRGARPGDVMAALRRESVVYYAAPRAFGRWANRPASLPWIAILAAVVLIAASALWQSSGLTASELSLAGERAVLPFWTQFPHGLLAAIFGSLVVLDVAILARGSRRFWRDMNRANPAGGESKPGLLPALRRILWHDDFGLCATSKARRGHHLLVVFGMVALFLTSLWVITARWNPLLHGLVYPLGLWNPWKLMANLAGLSVTVGVLMMLAERWKQPATAGGTTYSDLALLGLLLVIALTGFATEFLHLLRVEPLRFGVYLAHLVSIFTLLWLLPYSKLAHVVYRTLAMIHAAREGRRPS